MEADKVKPSRYSVRQRDKAALKQSEEGAQTSPQVRKLRTFRYLIYLQNLVADVSMRPPLAKDEMKNTGVDSPSNIYEPLSGNRCQASNSSVDVSKAVHFHHFQKLPAVGERS